MPRHTKNQAPPPGGPGTTEAAPSPNEMVEGAALNDAVAAENQVAPEGSDSPEATATSPAGQDDFGIPDIPEQATDANPSLAEPGTAEPTSPQDETPELEPTEDVAGEESQASVALSPEENLPLPNDGYAKQPSVPQDGGWFLPFVPPDPKPPATNPAPKPRPSTLGDLMDKCLRDLGIIIPTRTDTLPETASQTAAAAEPGSDPETAPPAEILTEPEVPLPPPRVATAVNLVAWIEQVILAHTHLSINAAKLVAYWVISTWFFDALDFFPCLVITGPAQDGNRLLHIFRNLCCQPAMLAGFRRSDLKSITCCRTRLISEPSLDKRTANLLSSLTDREFSVVSGGSFYRYSRSTAIYAGEDAETHKIQNAIHIHLAPSDAEPTASSAQLDEMMAHLPVHLEQYRGENLSLVNHRWWVLSGLSSETAMIGRELGRCILDAPELLQKLVALLKIQDKQRISEMSGSTDAFVLEAAWTLCRGGRDHAYAREIATEANRLREARGETARLNPEKVGHALKKLGLRTRRSQSGNRLLFDKATIAQIKQLAAMYALEDPSMKTENLHGPQVPENKKVE